MKKLLLIALSFCIFSEIASAQNTSKNQTPDKGLSEYDKKKLELRDKGFNKQKAIAEAKAKGIKASDIEGYVNFLELDYRSKQSLKKESHIHSPYEHPKNDVQETVIYIEPGKPMSVGCPNMGFENYDFSGWTGGIGTVSTGATYPNYTSTGTSIINPAGANVSVNNTANYHTIFNLPPVSPVWPNVNGWDSLACKAVGTQTISQIPLVSPFSFDPVSVRMNGAAANYRACRLKYITTTSSTNQRLSFSYAVVLQNPSGHTAGESPYFKVEVKNEGTGTILPGCTSYTFNPKSTVPADSLFQSNVGSTFDPTFYRKWQYYSVDLSTLPAGTNVSINFEVGGCSQSGHWGYAYVDAECGGIGTAYGNMCSGTNYATLVAPGGFNTYQWVDGSGPIVGATNDTLIVNNPTAGAVYTVNLVSPGGCALSQTVAINLTTVNIINLNSTSSCAGGASGTAYVQASGSNGVYTYSWTNTTPGPNYGAGMGTSQTVTGLAPGTYSVLVQSTTCGLASANISVGVAPPFYITQNHPFCGNSTLIIKGGGSNYTWYQGTTVIPAPNGTNDSLFIANAVAGDQYTLVYTNASGCRDSIKYTLGQITGGNSFITGVNNVCPGNSNGSANINLSTPFSAPYSYTVTNSSNTPIFSTSTSNTLVPVSPLSAGNYTASIYDGVCFYTTPFTINIINTTFTASATNTVLCFPTDTAKVYLDFGASPPSSCGLDPVVCASGNPITLFSAGPFTQNGTTTYPTPYGNWYTYAKHQFLVTKSDLNAAGIFAGKISSLAFNVLNLNASITNYPNFSIKMGCTNLSTMPSPTTPFLTGLQTVYSNANQPVSLGWVTHNFSQAYLWDGVSNIVIEVCFGMNSSFDYSDNVSVELKQMSYNASLFYREDSNPVCSGTQQADNSGAMTNGGNMLPNMKFGYCGYSAPASSYTVSVSSNGIITTNYGNDSLKIVPTFTAPPNPSAPTVYTFTVLNPEGGCVATRTLAILYPSNSTAITATPTSSTICFGSQVNLSATGAVNYDWSYVQGGSQIPLATTASIAVTPPAAGTNSYIVVGSSPCTMSTDTKTIVITVNPKADLIMSPLVDVTKCIGRDFIFTTGVVSTNTVSAAPPFNYSWTTLPGNLPAPGNNSSSSYICSSGSTTTLVVTVTGNCANQTSDTVVVTNFVNDLSVSIVDSSSTCANSEFTLNAVASNGYPDYFYSWVLLPDPKQISSSASMSYTSPAIEGTYTVQVVVSDSCGYTQTDYQLINVLPPCSIEIPNVITPNGDNINEVFIIKNLEHHPNTAVSIFDRWGKKVFSSPDYQNNWKADGVSDGTFFYIVEVPDDKAYNGFLTVFRGR